MNEGLYIQDRAGYEEASKYMYTVNSYRAKLSNEVFRRILKIP